MGTIYSCSSHLILVPSPSMHISLPRTKVRLTESHAPQSTPTLIMLPPRVTLRKSYPLWNGSSRSQTPSSRALSSPLRKRRLPPCAGRISQQRCPTAKHNLLHPIVLFIRKLRGAQSRQLSGCIAVSLHRCHIRHLRRIRRSSEQLLQLQTLLHQASYSILKQLGPAFKVVQEVGSPKRVVVESIAKGGEPEVEDR